MQLKRKHNKAIREGEGFWKALPGTGHGGQPEPTTEEMHHLQCPATWLLSHHSAGQQKPAAPLSKVVWLLRLMEPEVLPKLLLPG